MAAKPVRHTSNNSGGVPTVDTRPRAANGIDAAPSNPIVIPYWMRRIVRSVWDIARWIVSTAAFAGIGWAAVWYFFGTTTVTAEMDGKPIKATVVIDGKVVGKTPYETRLYPGWYNVEVQRPKAATGISLNEWYGFTVALGFDMNAEFTAEIEPVE